jgi:hypothetical protein
MGNGYMGKPTAATVATAPSERGHTAIPFDGQFDEFNLSIGNYTFDELSILEVGVINRMNEGVSANCQTLFSCPQISSGDGVYGSWALFDGVDDFLVQDSYDFHRSDYTIALWANSSLLDENKILLQLGTAADTIMELTVQGDGSIYFEHRASSSIGARAESGPGIFQSGQWNHLVAVKRDDTVSLYFNGEKVGEDTSATPLREDPSPFLIIGKSLRTESNHFTGRLDHLVIIPSAIADGDQYSAVDTLYSAPYPAIKIENDITEFNVPAQSAVTSSGTASVDSQAASSHHLFDQEVDAALQLQQPINYPIIDGQASSLHYFLPFEEVPGDTNFDNISQTFPTPDYICIHPWAFYGDQCPVAGRRGLIGRAAYFDGYNDKLFTDLAPNGAGYFRSLSVWVKGDRGTIAQYGSYQNGIKLTFNYFMVAMDLTNELEEQWVINFDLPENEWTHLAATYNRDTGEMRVYVNGSLYDSAMTIIPPWDFRPIKPVIGSGTDDADSYHGYLDDLRIYDVTLSDSDVQTLYNDSAPVLHLEFDEDENAAVFQSNTPNGLVATPTTEVCYNLSLIDLTVNSLAGGPSAINLDMDNGRIGQVKNAAVGSHNLNLHRLLCDTETLDVSAVFSGTATTLGSILLTPAPTTNTVNLTADVNSIDLTYAISAEPIHQVNPPPGTDGKIGNTAFFDGEGYLTIDDASEITNLPNDFTIMGWI